MRYWLFLLVMVLFFESHVQAQDNVMIICTHHRNELAAHGFTNIFERDGKYCVVLADSSMDVLNEVYQWFSDSFEAMLMPNQTGEVEEWIKKREEERERGLLDDFVDWPPEKTPKKGKEEGYLDEFVNWETGENFSGDMDRYSGPGVKQKTVLGKQEEWLDNMFNFWNVDD